MSEFYSPKYPKTNYFHLSRCINLNIPNMKFDQIHNTFDKHSAKYVNTSKYSFLAGTTFSQSNLNSPCQVKLNIEHILKLKLPCIKWIFKQTHSNPKSTNLYM